MKRAVAILLAGALSVASAVPVLGTRMLCGAFPATAGSMEAAKPAADPLCAACPDRAQPTSAATLEAGTCCRVAPIDETNALTATLASAGAPSSGQGRALAPALSPSPSSHDAGLVAASRSMHGPPSAASPPKPTRSTILRN